ncbi:gamma-aminobutyric acid type B receptor subunit 2-like [Glandiceps talaboti]
MKLFQVSFLVVFTVYNLIKITNGNLKTPLYIGGLFPHDYDGFYGGLLQYAERAIEHVNNSTAVLDDYELKMVWRPIMKDGIENIGLALHSVFDFVYRGPQIVYIWGPTYSHTVYDVNRLTTYYNIPQETLSWIQLLENDNVTILSVSTLKSDNARDVVRILKSFDTRITLFGSYPKEAANLMCAAYKQGMYGPRYVYIMPGWYHKKWWKETPTNCTVDQMDIITKGYIGVDALPVTDHLERINFTGKPPTKEEMNFYRDFRASILESDYNTYVEYSYDIIWSIALALNSADNILCLSKGGKRIHEFTYNDSDIAKLVWEETRKLVVHGMTGIILFDKNAVRQSPVVIEQLQNGNQVKVCTYDKFTDEMICTDQFTWEGDTPPVDGVTHLQNILTLSDVYIWVIYSLTTIEVLMAIGLIGMSIVYRNNRVMKLSSAMVTIFIPIGCLILSISVFLFGVDLSRVSPGMVTFVCLTREVFIWIGLSLGFGALFAKTYRIHIIFNSALRKMKTTKHLRDGKLIFFILTLVTLDGALLVVRLLVDTTSLEAVLLEPSMDLSHPPQEIMITPVVKLCSSKYQLYFLLVVLIIKSILFLSGTCLAWKTRTVHVSELNESQYIALSVYVTVVTSVIATPVVVVMQTNVNVVFVVVGGAILMANATVMSLVYVPKILLIHREQKHPGKYDKQTFLFCTAKGDEPNRKVIQDLSDELKTNRKFLQKVKLILRSMESVADDLEDRKNT